MAVKLEDKQNVLAPGSTYPYGNIQDNTGSSNGTPVNTAVYGDFHQFFANMLSIAEGQGWMTANGLPDNDDNGFQYHQALLICTRLGNYVPLFVLAETIIGGTAAINTATPYALFRLSDSGTAISPGYIYYNNFLYRCGGLTYTAIVHDLQFNITGEGIMTITDSATPGLFQYSDVVLVESVWHTVGVAPEPLFQNSWTTSSSVQFKKEKNVVSIRGRASNAGSLTTVVFTLPVGFRPSAEVLLLSAQTGAVDNLKSGTVLANGDVSLASGADTNKTLLFHVTFNIA